jgi:2-oxoglutarate dehydrogenase E2 component (dihydrolipoamide succinyltransferase)
MPTPVVMPQMGESIAEGTIVRWIKKVGDSVDRDEPLFEISTDKVDAEIPSPAAGVLTEIKAREGETVPVNSVVATIALDGESGPPSGEAPPAPTARAAQTRQGVARASASTQPQPDGAGATAEPKAGGGANGSGSAQVTATPPQTAPVAEKPEDARRQKSSPLVRRIAQEHNVDISRIAGSGIGGRVTKNDVLAFLGRDQGSGLRDQEGMTGGSPVSMRGPEQPIPSPESRIPAREGAHVEPLSVIRRKIAEHMILSRRTSAHVHSVFHVNFSTVERIRQQKKAEYERAGAKLTYMAFIVKAVVDALRHHRIVNASLDGDTIVYHPDINIGIAVALDTGLIVPVITHADEKNILGLTRAIADLAERSRTKQLKPHEVQGGTFTITNPGQFGAQFGMPIINQPQVAILGVGTIEKRPVVIDDAIAIRAMAYLTLGFDHRLIDGAVADQFMADVKRQIENFDINQV